MARQRMVRPEVFADEYLNELPPLVRWVYLSLKSWADREGRLEDRPRRLRVQCIPHDQVSNGEFDEMLWTLATFPEPEPYLTRYTVDGRDYIQINGWAKDQHPHVNESHSTCPPVSAGRVRTKACVGASTIQAPCEHRSSTPESDTESESETDSESDSTSRLPARPLPPLPVVPTNGNGHAPAVAGATEPPAIAAAVVAAVQGSKVRSPRRGTQRAPASIDTPENRAVIDAYNEILLPKSPIGYGPGNLKAAQRALCEGYTLENIRSVFAAVRSRASPTAAWCADNNREFEYLIRPAYKHHQTHELVHGPLDKIPNEIATGRRQ